MGFTMYRRTFEMPKRVTKDQRVYDSHGAWFYSVPRTDMVRWGAWMLSDVISDSFGVAQLRHYLNDTFPDAHLSDQLVRQYVHTLYKAGFLKRAGVGYVIDWEAERARRLAMMDALGLPEEARPEGFRMTQ